MRPSILIALIALGGPLPAAAQALIYKPINPSFGGDAFNSSHLLGIAGAQNPYKAKSTTKEQSEADLFASQLKSRILSGLANKITDAIFGENAQDNGTFAVGDQTISFTRGLDAIHLVITDGRGGTTNIDIPTLVNGG